MYLPKREELSLRFVLAFPNASRTGLLPINLTLTASTFFLWPVAAAMNSKIFLDASVFPDPDSPKLQLFMSYNLYYKYNFGFIKYSALLEESAGIL